MHAPAPLSAVVFDLGGVLIDWDPRHLYRRVFDDPAAMAQCRREVCSPAWNAEQDRGRPWGEAIASLTAAHPGHASEIALYRSRWHEMIGGPLEGSVALLAALRRAGRPCYALSNWSTDTFAEVEPRFPFLSWFDDRVISGHVGMVKPEEGVFRLAIERFGVEPSRTLFVDDSPANVAAATRLGFVALRFRSPEQLRGVLVRHGLLEG